MPSLDINVILHGKSDGSIEKIVADMETGKKKLEQPIKLKPEVEKPDTKPIEQAKQNIENNTVKIKVEFDQGDIKGSLSELQKQLQNIKDVLNQITATNGKTKKLPIAVEGIDQLLSKLDMMKESLYAIQDAQNVTRSRSVVETEKKQWEAVVKAAEDGQRQLENAYRNIDIESRRKQISGLFETDSNTIKKTQDFIDNIKTIYEKGGDLANMRIGPRDEKHNPAYSILQVVQKLRDVDPEAVGNQFDHMFDAMNNFQIKDMSEALNGVQTIEQAVDRLNAVRNEFERSKNVVQTSTTFSADSVTKLTEALKAALTAAQHTNDELGKNGGKPQDPYKDIVSSINKAKASIDLIANVFKPLQADAKPIELSVNVSQALENIKSVSDAIEGLKDKKVDLDVNVKNKEDVGKTLKGSLESSVQSSLNTSNTDISNIGGNIASTVTTINNNISTISTTMTSVVSSFQQLDSAISNSSSNIGNLVDAVSKLDISQNSASTYVSSPVENIERLATAYDTMNKSLSSAEEAQKHLVTLSSTTTDQNGNKIDVSYASQLADLETSVSNVHQSIGKLKKEIADIQSGFKDIDLKDFGNATKTIVNSLSRLPEDSETKITQLSNAIKQLKESSQGLDGNNLKIALDSFKIPEDTPTKIQNLATAFDKLRESLQQFSDGENASGLTSIMDSLNQLLKNSENLKALSNALKASEDKIKAVREATKTDEEKQAEKDYDTETKRMQTESYNELTDAVKRYVAAAKEMAAGNKSGKWDTDSLKKQREDIDALSESIKNNSRIYDEAKFNKSLSQLNTLPEELRKINVSGITEETRKAYENAESFINRASKYKDNENIQKYLTEVKAKADEVKIALEQIGTGQITGDALKNKGRELTDLINNYKDELDAVANQRALEGNPLIRSTGINQIMGKAQNFVFENADTKVDAFKEKINILNDELQKTTDIMKNIDPKNLKTGDLQTIKDQAKALNDALKQAQGAYPVDTEAQKRSLASFDTWLSKNSLAVAKHGEEVQALRDNLNNATTRLDLSTANTQIEEFKARLTEAGDVGLTFGEKLQRSFSSLGRYLMSYVSFYRIIGALKEGVNIAKEFDKAMTDIKMVSNETEKTYSNMQKASFSIAEQIGGDALTIQKSMGTWLRLGKSIEESQEAAKASNWLVNVSEFDNIDEASTALVSIKQAYDDLGYEDILDKLNAVGDSFSSSTDALASGLQGAAGVLKIQGNDINESLALLTAGSVVARNYRNIIYSTCLIALVA